MNYKKCYFLIIFSFLIIFNAVLPADNVSGDEKSVLKGLQNDDNKSELIEKIEKPNDIVERGLVGDIEKLLKVAEILETVGQKVIPAILNINPTSAGIETEVDIEPTALSSKRIHDGLFHIRQLEKNVDKLKSRK